MATLHQQRCINGHKEANAIAERYANDDMYIVIGIIAYAGDTFVQDINSCSHAWRNAQFVMRSDAIEYAKKALRADVKNAKLNGKYNIDIDGLTVQWQGQNNYVEYRAYVVCYRGIAVNI